jgi:Domain of unknown function (DUF4440)
VIRNLLLLCLCLIATPILPATGQSAKAQASAPANQIDNPNSVFRTISSLDKELFDAVDRCDMTKFASFWAEDAEFYHDKGGLTIGRKNIVESVRTNLCGKVKRKLMRGTLEVHPIGSYGAVEIGIHRFLHPWEQDHGVVGEAKFIHLWQHKDGAWKITRVISYDHHVAK